MPARQPVEDSDDNLPLFGPRPPLEVVPLTTLPVIMVVAPPVPTVTPPDSDSDDEDRQCTRVYPSSIVAERIWQNPQ